MSVGARYGLCLGLATGVLLGFAPQPLGAVLLWSAFAVQLAVGGALVWGRMRLPYATAAMLLDACGSALLAYWYAQGYDLFSLPVAGAVLLAVIFALSLVTLLILEPRANPQKWQTWGAFMQEKSVLDVLLGRHIPVLRSDS